ncbi:hypothetical protein LXL04_010463 [Taraxacum kok-saghyz]
MCLTAHILDTPTPTPTPTPIPTQFTDYKECRTYLSTVDPIILSKPVKFPSDSFPYQITLPVVLVSFIHLSPDRFSDESTSFPTPKPTPLLVPSTTVASTTVNHRITATPQSKVIVLKRLSKHQNTILYNTSTQPLITKLIGINQMEFQKPILVAFLLSTLILTAFADCTCELEENNGNDSIVLKYELIALACILIAGGIGVSLPFAGNIFTALRPENDSFFLVKAFASGVILATGFIHILPDAFERFVAMVATILTLLIETSASAYQLRVQTEAATKLVGGEDEEKNAGNVDVHMHANNHGHVHGFMLPPINDSEVHRYRIVSQCHSHNDSHIFFPAQNYHSHTINPTAVKIKEFNPSAPRGVQKLPSRDREKDTREIGELLDGADEPRGRESGRKQEAIAEFNPSAPRGVQKLPSRDREKDTREIGELLDGADEPRGRESGRKQEAIAEFNPSAPRGVQKHPSRDREKDTREIGELLDGADEPRGRERAAGSRKQSPVPTRERERQEAVKIKEFNPSAPRGVQKLPLRDREKDTREIGELLDGADEPRGRESGRKQEAIAEFNPSAPRGVQKLPSRDREKDTREIGELLDGADEPRGRESGRKQEAIAEFNPSAPRGVQKLPSRDREKDTREIGELLDRADEPRGRERAAGSRKQSPVPTRERERQEAVKIKEFNPSAPRGVQKLPSRDREKDTREIGELLDGADEPRGRESGRKQEAIAEFNPSAPRGVQKLPSRDREKDTREIGELLDGADEPRGRERAAGSRKQSPVPMRERERQEAVKIKEFNPSAPRGVQKLPSRDREKDTREIGELLDGADEPRGRESGRKQEAIAEFNPSAPRGVQKLPSRDREKDTREIGELLDGADEPRGRERAAGSWKQSPVPKTADHADLRQQPQRRPAISRCQQMNFQCRFPVSISTVSSLRYSLKSYYLSPLSICHLKSRRRNQPRSRDLTASSDFVYFVFGFHTTDFDSITDFGGGFERHQFRYSSHGNPCYLQLKICTLSYVTLRFGFLLLWSYAFIFNFYLLLLCEIKPQYEKVARVFNGADAAHPGIMLLTRLDCANKAKVTNNYGRRVKFLDEKWCPKFLVIITQKNHHTKFFLPGSLLIMYNQGTTRPTQYLVLYDENGFSAAVLQELVHSLSYCKYQHSTTAMSVGVGIGNYCNFVRMVATIATKAQTP